MSELDMDSLLDMTLDDIDDLPEFKTFPAGVHMVLATFEAKEINDKAAVSLKFKLMENLEMADPSQEAPKAGDECSTMFMLANEYGLGNLKKAAAAFEEMVGSSNLKAIVEGVQDVECVIVTSLQKNKNDPDNPYLKLKDISVV